MELLRFSLLIIATVLVANVSSQCTRDAVTDCVVYDSTHIKQFDGKVVSVSSTCSFTLVNILDRNLKINYLKKPSAIQLLYKSQNYLISLDVNGNVVFTVDGVPKKIPSTVAGVTVSQPGSMAIIELKNLGIKVRFNGDLVEVIQDNQNNVMVPSGLCGNNDGCDNNDLMLSDGTIVTSPLQWANNWALDNCQSSTFQSVCGANPLALKNSNNYCNSLFGRTEFTGCSAFTALYKTICQSNYCGCKKATPEECQCDLLDSYTRACQTKNNNIMNWRSFGLCKINCNNIDQQYMTCPINRQQLSCGQSPQADPTRIDCEEGCYCPAGMRWFEGQCVLTSECPCFYNSRRYESGESVTQVCNLCTCTNGNWNCPNPKCCCETGYCVGDPHYKTFDGLLYDFMGKCDYYVLRSFFADVICEHYVRNAQGVPYRDFASNAPSLCMSIRVISNGHVIKIGQQKITKFDNRPVKHFPYIRDGIRVVQKNAEYHAIILENGVEIQFNGIWSVYVVIPQRMINRVEGLLGVYSKSTADDMRKPDGTLAANLLDFGNSWKVPGSCTNDYQNDAVDPCVADPSKKPPAEQFCAHILGPLFAGCSEDPQADYDACVYDGCLCLNDDPKCLCGMYETQARKCAVKGTVIDWRSTVTQCPFPCPAGTTYQFQANPCQRTCDDISRNTNDGQCLISNEDCVCPQGQAFNDKNQCVPISQCNCIYEGVRFPGGFIFVIEDEALRYDCVNARWVITAATAQDMRDFPSVEEFTVECSAIDSKRYAGCKRVNTLTCYNQHLEELGDYDNCVAGCECLPGFVMDTALEICVRPIDCPCLYKGISYPDDSVISNREERCTCVDGLWECVPETDHWEICSVFGDVHVRTFDETFFSFNGFCEYVMLQHDFGTTGSFRVSVETGFCPHGACIVAAYIRFRAENGNIDNVVFAPGQNYVASQNLQNLVITDLGASVMVDVIAFGARIIWGIDGWIHIHAGPNWLTWPFSGLCGVYDNDPTNDLQVTGQTLNGVADFVDYNRLDNTCDATSEIPLEDMIIVSECEYILSDVFQTCGLLLSANQQQYYQSCIKSGQLQADLDPTQTSIYYCDILAAFAQECADVGAPVNWRTSTICPLQCAAGKEYYTCDTPCARKNCANMATGCPDKVCAESCNTPQCSNGQVYLDATNTACVDPANCPVLRRSSARNAFSLFLARA
ncbi:von Willebrand factor-like [Onthophagus taurus]|uniref:von Willebrand factor-like n=1 Tax=Onthophagus taurus TaxID=166361 RepID=UPI0039BDE67B